MTRDNFFSTKCFYLFSDFLFFFFITRNILNCLELAVIFTLFLFTLSHELLYTYMIKKIQSLQYLKINYYT